MLSSRQIEILMDFYAQSEVYITSEQIAKKFHISVRTIKNDIAALRDTIQSYGANLISTSSKGYCLRINDQTAFEQMLADYLDTYQGNHFFNNQNSRIHYILEQLLQAKDYIQAQTLADKLYISRSVISKDLVQLKSLLNSYALTLESKPSYGLRILGAEQDKRRCLIRENIPLIRSSHGLQSHYDFLIGIRDLSLEILIKEQFKVSDIVFQNLVLHIATAVARMKGGYVLEYKSQPLDANYQHVLKIAEQIIQSACSLYQLTYNPEEVQLLALNLQGKREYDDPDYITEEMNDFVFQTLSIIKEKYNFDLLQDTHLRISLALHTIPLLYRVKSNMQLKNIMKFNIKQNHALAFDLATTYAYQLQQQYFIQLNDDEISFIALHFSLSLNSSEQMRKEKKILLISAQKRSESILIQQKIYQWFQDQITSFDVISKMEINLISLDDYDTILTTEKDVLEIIGNSVFVPYFLSNDDYSKIELAINGFTSSKDILNKFDSDLFFVLPPTEKKEIIQFLCEAAQKKYPMSQSLFDTVWLHENIASSYFGNQMAIPHPERLISENTFIAVAILEKEMNWINEESVRVVMLVCVEKNNPKAYQIWYYLSYLISNQQAIEDIVQEPTFERFQSVIHNLYENIFKK